MFGRIIQTLAVIDAVLISVFYYELSVLTPKEYLSSGHYASFGFWIDYVILMFIIFLSFYLYYKRSEFKGEFIKTFKVNNQMQLDIATDLFCKKLPLIILVGLLIFSVRYWP